MPELPEVETIARDLRRDLVGRRVTNVEVRWERIVARPAVDELTSTLLGRQILGVDRRGKYLIFPLSGNESLLIHLRMTGQLHVVTSDVPLDKHTHVIFSLDSGKRFIFHDTRKFGRVYLVKNVNEVVGALGPEPLDPDFSPHEFSRRVSARKTPIKSVLLDQSVIAGIGNIYADEILFAAGINPRRASNELAFNEVSRIHTVMRQVLAQAIFDRGSSLANYQRPGGARGLNQERHQVFRRTGKPCKRCGSPIQRVVVGQRATHFCPQCQI